MNRDPDRLYKFYERMWFIHMQVPDMRFGQLMDCFYTYCKRDKNLPSDMFYIEDGEFLDLLGEYCEVILGCGNQIEDQMKGVKN